MRVFPKRSAFKASAVPTASSRGLFDPRRRSRSLAFSVFPFPSLPLPPFSLFLFPLFPSLPLPLFPSLPLPPFPTLPLPPFPSLPLPLFPLASQLEASVNLGLGGGWGVGGGYSAVFKLRLQRSSHHCSFHTERTLNFLHLPPRTLPPAHCTPPHSAQSVANGGGEITRHAPAVLAAATAARVRLNEAHSRPDFLSRFSPLWNSRRVAPDLFWLCPELHRANDLMHKLSTRASVL